MAGAYYTQVTETTGLAATLYPMPPIQLGLCCMNTVLRAQKPPVYPSRTMTMKMVEAQGLDVLKAKVRSNLQDVLTMMDWNYAHLIHVFRLSSDLFIHATNPAVPHYGYEFALDLLHQIGAKAQQYNMRLTFHPGQYNVIGTPHAKAWSQTVADLSYHAQLLDVMGCGPDSVMVVHFGGVYGDKPATVERWVQQFAQLSAAVRSRLVIENCERQFNILDCLALSERVNVPVVFDTHHHDCYRALHPEECLLGGEAYMAAVLHTWARRGIKPKFHVSEQGEGKLGHHSHLVQEIPQYLLDIPARYGVDIDIMVEAKGKEQALAHLFTRHADMLCIPVGLTIPAPPTKVASVKRKRECAVCE